MPWSCNFVGCCGRMGAERESANLPKHKRSVDYIFQLQAHSVIDLYQKATLDVLKHLLL